MYDKKYFLYAAIITFAEGCDVIHISNLEVGTFVNLLKEIIIFFIFAG